MTRWLEFPHFRAGAFSDLARRGFTASARTGSRLRDSRRSVLGSSVVTEPDSNRLMSIVFNYHTGDILSDTICMNVENPFQRYARLYISYLYYFTKNFPWEVGEKKARRKGSSRPSTLL